jgi:hypothetical protein
LAGSAWYCWAVNRPLPAHRGERSASGFGIKLNQPLHDLQPKV